MGSQRAGLQPEDLTLTLIDAALMPRGLHLVVWLPHLSPHSLSHCSLHHSPGSPATALVSPLRLMFVWLSIAATFSRLTNSLRSMWCTTLPLHKPCLNDLSRETLLSLLALPHALLPACQLSPSVTSASTAPWFIYCCCQLPLVPEDWEQRIVPCLSAPRAPAACKISLLMACD